MTNGICNFTLKDGQEIDLLFGMRAVLIFSQKLGAEMERNDIQDVKEVDHFKAFAYIIYGGMCNNADRKDEKFPSFEEAYDMAIKINEEPEIAKSIYDAWEDSKATKDMVDRIAGATAETAKEDTKKKTTSKSKPTQ